jgi:hypothetical protein
MSDGLASLLPLNARMFLRHLMRDEGEEGSLMTAGDFSPSQIDLLYEEIEKKERENALREESIREALYYTQEGLDPSSSLYGESRVKFKTDNENLIRQDNLGSEDPVPEGYAIVGSGGGKSGNYRTIARLRSEDEIDRLLLNQANNYMNQLDSFERTRGKTSVVPAAQTLDFTGQPVTEDKSKVNQSNFLKSLKDSLVSDDYNIATTLGQFNAFRNKDGTITIKDEYNFNPIRLGSALRPDGSGETEYYEKDEEDETRLPFSFLDLMRDSPGFIPSPEIAANYLARTVFPDKKSPVEFTLPKKHSLPNDYSLGGKINLI